MIRAEMKQSEKKLLNKVRFDEVLKTEFDAPLIGSLDIPKYTLHQIGWQSGDKIIIHIDKE